MKIYGIQEKMKKESSTEWRFCENDGFTSDLKEARSRCLHRWVNYKKVDLDGLFECRVVEIECDDSKWRAIDIS